LQKSFSCRFREGVATACEAAGDKEALFDDLRLTALTNMIQAGLSEKEAMEISGHRTRALFDRYHIISDRRMKQNPEISGNTRGRRKVPRRKSAQGKRKQEVNLKSFLMVSRAGLEPATTALKVRIRGYWVHRHALYRGLFALAVRVSALVRVKMGKDTEEDAV